MGDKYEVHSWECIPGRHPRKPDAQFYAVTDYHFVLKYRGRNLIKALYAALLAKRQGAGMIKVEVR